MPSRTRWMLFAALFLFGCPRMIPVPVRDAGVDATGAGYDPVQGYSFEGPLVLDDDRQRALDSSTLRDGPSPCRPPMLARVQFVNDGDTFEVTAEDGTFAGRVRFIGVDTPELSAPAECYSSEATAFTEQLDGHLVWLTFDNTCFDIYDRLLAYVHVGGGNGDFWQRQLLQRGFATVFTVGDNRNYRAIFEADELAASGARTGLWGACF